MDGVIRPHCMGSEFPKRDTDSPRVRWVMPSESEWKASMTELAQRIISKRTLPSAADLDAVAEEQRVKEKTGAQVPNR
jgi:hypothetical protein